jgi:hypothetical protein
METIWIKYVRQTMTMILSRPEIIAPGVRDMAFFPHWTVDGQHSAEIGFPIFPFLLHLLMLVLSSLHFPFMYRILSLHLRFWVHWKRVGTWR